MVAKNKSKSPIIDSVNNIMNDFVEAGLVDDITMREFKALKIKTPKQYSPKKITKIRKNLGVSQAVFAKLLNLTPSTVQKWETGAKKPSGASMMLLHIADKKGLSGLIV